MSIRSKIEDDFSSEIYTPFSALKEELERRWNDKELKQKVENFFRENFIKELDAEPRAVMSRTIATPNVEFFYYLDLAKTLDLKPLILEYPDKFVAKNHDKYHLAKLYFYKKTDDMRTFPVSSAKIVDFNKDEGKRFRDINTIWGENIRDFHHSLLFKSAPEMKGNILDFSDWFDSTRYSSKFYYLYFLSLFVRNGVLFENFLIGDNEESGFIKEKFLPSFKEVERIFGVKPLIFPLLPFTWEQHPHWVSYHESLCDSVMSKVKSAVEL